MLHRRHFPRRVRRVRLRDSDEWSLIVACAARAGLEPSTYLREAALREARRDLARPTSAEDLGR